MNETLSIGLYNYRILDVKTINEICNKIESTLSVFNIYPYFENTTNALNIDDNDYLLYYYIGVSYYQIQDYIKAIDYLNISIEKNQTYSFAYYYLGLAYCSAGLYDNAIDMLEKATSLDESNKEAYISLSNAYSAVGDLENSAIALKKYDIY